MVSQPQIKPSPGLNRIFHGKSSSKSRLNPEPDLRLGKLCVRLFLCSIDWMLHYILSNHVETAVFDFQVVILSSNSFNHISTCWFCTSALCILKCLICTWILTCLVIITYSIRYTWLPQNSTQQVLIKVVQPTVTHTPSVNSVQMLQACLSELIWFVI